MHTKEELEKERLRYDIKNLKYGWVQRWSSVMGLVVVMCTAVGTNLSSYLKSQKLEAKERQLGVALQDSEKVLKQAADSLKRFDASTLNKEIKLEERMQENKEINMKFGSKDEEVQYYKKECDSLTTLIIEEKTARKELGTNVK